MRYSTNELKDIAKFSIASSILYDDDADFEYINAEISQRIERVKANIKKVIEFYKDGGETQKRILNQLNAMETAIRCKKGEYSMTATQMAFEICRVLCAPSENKGRIVNERLRQFWESSNNDIMQTLYAAYDKNEKYEQYAENSESLAYFLKGL